MLEHLPPGVRHGIGVGVDLAAGLLGGGNLTIGVDRLDELVRQVTQRDAGNRFEVLSIVGGDARVESGDP